MLDPTYTRDQVLILKQVTLEQNLSKSHDFDSLAFAAINFYIHRTRRSFLQLHSVQQIQSCMAKRWNKFGRNLAGVFKLETLVTD